MNELQKKYNELKANNEKYLETIKSQQEKIDVLVKEKHETSWSWAVPSSRLEVEVDGGKCGVEVDGVKCGVEVEAHHY